MPTINRSIHHFVKFIGIGGTSTAIQFALLTLLVELNIFSKVPASFIAYLLSSIFNYLANYYFTFKSDVQHKTALPKFIAAVALGVSVNTILFWLMLKVTDHYLLAQFVATGLTVLLNFAVHKLWIYRNH